ncbi:hypothetical protein ACHHYP_05424 [Achlya hypogyna]|uniref:Sensor domain-containing protein n=1 Tax=Achlya hypogyna TaxID=1202772 RepID=A0A1V9ZNP7_ACHHY|nr:hypothetical protein ACHHYP_05424 [Achlya hypogyna]
MYPVLSPTEKTPVLTQPSAPAIAPSAPPVAVPMYGGYQAAPVYYAPPPPTDDTSGENTFWYALTSPLRLQTFKLIFFHGINVVFAIVAFTLVMTVGSLGLGLIPLCCLGLLVLQFLLHLVRVFAECDVYLYNCIAPRADQITVNFSVPRRGLYHVTGYRLSPSLSTVSAESVLAVFYFAIVKLPLSLMFSLTPLLILTVAGACVSFPAYWKDEYATDMTYMHHHRLYTVHAQVLGVPMDERHKTDVALAGVVLVYFAVLCLHGFGAVLRGTTKFFTCEYFSTTGVVHHQRTESVPHTTYFYAPSAPMYAPAVQTELPTVASVPRRRGTFERYLTKLGNMVMLVLLSLLSMSFSIGVLIVVLVGVSCGIGFLPLACLGLIVLNCLMACVRPLATLDEALFRQRQQLYTAIIN